MFHSMPCFKILFNDHKALHIVSPRCVPWISWKESQKNWAWIDEEGRKLRKFGHELMTGRSGSLGKLSTNWCWGREEAWVKYARTDAEDEMRTRQINTHLWREGQGALVNWPHTKNGRRNSKKLPTQWWQRRKETWINWLRSDDKEVKKPIFGFT